MKNVKIGALWTKKNANGDEYFSGEIVVNGRPVKIVVFKNERKTTEKHPDYRILLSNNTRDGITTEDYIGQ